MILADIWDHFTNSGIGITVLGVLAGLTAYILVLQAVKVSREAFGRQPPITEAFNDYKEEMRLRIVGLEKQISEARHEFDERVNSEMVRTEEHFEEILILSEKRATEVGLLIKTVSRLEERTETHLRKLDQYDTKLDNLLKDVARATRNSHNS